MRWIDLAFLHWSVPVAALRPLVPAALEVDTFGDRGWIAVTPFRMTRVRPRFLPPVPGAADFPELNVRTYVRHRGRGGVYFFSLDAASALAVAAARVATGLPYFRATMSHRRVGDEIVYASSRSDRDRAPAFRVRYQPTGEVFHSVPGSLEHWGTERYSLFVQRRRRLHRLDIEHAPWPLQPASVTIQENTMLPVDTGADTHPPHVLFARCLDVVAHLPVLA